MGAPIRIVVLNGDETGQELLEQAVRVLEPSLPGLDLELTHFDLSLENRRATGNDVVIAAAAAMRETGLGLKAATVTPDGAGDVGSPNRILREEVGGKDHRPHRPEAARRTHHRRRALPDLRRPHGGRGRLRLEAVARGRARGRG